MVSRAIWKGHLKIAELACPVALHAAASTSERVTFHTLNRKTGHRVHREFVDEDTGEPVAREDQVKGFETAKDQYIFLEPEEMAAAVPEADKALSVEGFLACSEVDTVYFDRPYYVVPADMSASPAYGLICEGMRTRKVAAFARALLFRRMRNLVIRVQGGGLVANTLKFDYEVRPAAAVFDSIPDLEIEGEMLDLAKYIIGTKRGEFDPWTFEDRYNDALAELVKAKREGRPLPKAPARPEGKVVSLMDALRESAVAANGGKKAAKSSARRSTKSKEGARRRAG